MARLLYIEASPRKDRSTSIKVAGTLLEKYRETHPEDSVDMLDLWKTELPPFDGEAINAKYAILHGEQHTEALLKAWPRGFRGIVFMLCQAALRKAAWFK